MLEGYYACSRRSSGGKSYVAVVGKEGNAAADRLCSVDDGSGQWPSDHLRSAADLVATLFFSVMRYDPKKPHDRANDVFVLSKGHAAPLLYAAWAEAGYIPRDKLLILRKIDSDIEGNPNPRLPLSMRPLLHWGRACRWAWESQSMRKS